MAIDKINLVTVEKMWRREVEAAATYRHLAERERDSKRKDILIRLAEHEVRAGHEERVGILPFGLLIDQWRWKVFSGEIQPSKYNESWWQLREKYQGVAAPVARSEQDFDPGAKYHVAANVPYMRYFLADILQFQFHRALAKTAGCTEPLHRCSIFNNKESGARLQKMMEMGKSQPWPEELEVLTGQKRMDATAIVDYFAPLQIWLDEQNKGENPGW